MRKKSDNIQKEKPVDLKEVYQGATWQGPSGLMSPDFGILEKGKLYTVNETTAKNSNDWLPVYGPKI